MDIAGNYQTGRLQAILNAYYHGELTQEEVAYARSLLPDEMRSIYRHHVAVGAWHKRQVDLFDQAFLVEQTAADTRKLRGVRIRNCFQKQKV